MAKLQAQTGATSDPKADRKALRARREQQILGTTWGHIEPRPVTWSYRTSLFVVAVAMVVLPLLYIALFAVAAYGILWHATHYQTVAALAGRWATLAYVGPLAAGLMFIICLIKPIFARRIGHEAPWRVNRDAEPLLYAYVERVCEALGAPVPRTIRVDSDCNAAAGFRLGLQSFVQSDLVLIIGLPFAAGLSLREFTGVLAHEFGHFSQRTGMRLGYLIKHINLWFARIVYQRDPWDERLQFGAENWHAPFSWFCRLVLAFNWLARRPIWLLMTLGHMLSCIVSREMEYDADRCQSRLVGWRTAAQSHKRIGQLSIAREMSLSDIEQFWEEERLVDDLMAMIAANSTRITPEMMKALVKQDAAAETGLWDTHPSLRDRIGRLKAANDAGSFDPEQKLSKLPATVLFENFERLSKSVTLRLYREVLGPGINSRLLRPAAELLEEQRIEREAFEALHRYFQVRIPAFYPLPLGNLPAAAPEHVREAVAAVKTHRRQMLEGLAEYKKCSKRYEAAETELLKLTRAIACLHAGVAVDEDEFHFEEPTVAAAAARMRQVRKHMQKLSQGLFAFESDAGVRLSSALQLLFVKEVTDRIAGGVELRDEVELLIPEARFVSELMADLVPFREVYTSLLAVCEHLGKGRISRRLAAAFLFRLHNVYGRLARMGVTLGDRYYPFEHGRAEMTLHEFAIPAMPAYTNLAGVIGITQLMFTRLIFVQARLFARLAAAAEQVESALGLPTLATPVEKEDAESTG